MRSRCRAILVLPLALLWACEPETGGVAGVTAPAFSGHAPPGVPGLVSWWPGANTMDVAGPNDGVLVNGATIGTGRIGPGFRFDGVDDYVMVPQHPSLDLGAQGSLVFWMRADPGNPLKCNPHCQGLVTTDYFLVEISPSGPDGGINFVVATTTGSDPVFAHTSDANGNAGAQVTPGEWHHVAGTYDGTKLQLYIDGQAWGNPRFTTGIIVPMAPGSFLAIGSEDGRDGPGVCPGCIRRFHGDIDEVAIYDRALTAAEVNGLYRRGGSQ